MEVLNAPLISNTGAELVVAVLGEDEMLPFFWVVAVQTAHSSRLPLLRRWSSQIHLPRVSLPTATPASVLRWYLGV